MSHGMMPAMSLATRCTACGTIFRVVQDQLRVSEGWVRCGRCAEVFDAREQLFDLERDAPPPWPAAAVGDEATLQQTPDAEEPPHEEEAAPPPTARALPSDEEKTWSMPPESEPLEESFATAEALAEPALSSAGAAALHDGEGQRREPYWDEPPPAAWQSSAAPIEPAPPSARIAAPDDAAAPVAPLPSAAPEPANMPLPPAAQTEAANAPDVSFLRQADKKAGGARRLLLPGLLALLLTLLLLGQLVWQFRNALQAVLPQSAPLLRSLCDAAGCSLEPWKRIDALEVENSGLTQAGSGNHYKLSVQLRNKAAYPVALPWVDLSLTDGSGAQVLRRMLKPGDFNLGAQASIAGHGEQSLQLVFSTGKLKVSSYQVVIFHP